MSGAFKTEDGFFYPERPRLVQIALSTQDDTVDTLYALDNGGRVWLMVIVGELKLEWRLLPAVPFGRPVPL